MSYKLIVIAMLGAVWGILEAQLGTMLHALGLPFIGALMMSFGLLFLIAARMITNLRFSSLLLAFVVSFIKFLFVGGIAIYPLLGIILQATIFELLVWNNRAMLFRYLLASGFCLTYSLFHPFLTQGLLGGWKIMAVYSRLVDSGSAVLGLPDHFGYWILIFLVVCHFLIGSAAAFVAFHFIKILERRGVLSFSIVNKKPTMLSNAR